jgi:hypothetical protein
VTYLWKSLDKGYKFALDLMAIRGLKVKLWALKVAGILAVEFRDSQVGVLGQKAIWMLPLWRAAENTIKGKVVASPKFRP